MLPIFLLCIIGFPLLMRGKEADDKQNAQAAWEDECAAVNEENEMREQARAVLDADAGTMDRWRRENRRCRLEMLAMLNARFGFDVCANFSYEWAPESEKTIWRNLEKLLQQEFTLMLAPHEYPRTGNHLLADMRPELREDMMAFRDVILSRNYKSALTEGLSANPPGR